MEVIAPLPCAQLRREGASTFTVAWAPAGPCHTPATTLARVVPAGELRVLHADDDVVIVDKPAFLPTENTRWLKDSVRSRLERAHGALTCVHRLDWETSGCERAIQSCPLKRAHMNSHGRPATWRRLLVLARSKVAARCLSAQFADRSIDKEYVADVIGAPPASNGLVRLPLAPDDVHTPNTLSYNRLPRAVTALRVWQARPPRQCVDLAGKLAETRWEVLRQAAAGGAEEGVACRLRLTPSTGRRHQLRVHCLAIGCAIAGDALYTPQTGRAGHECLHPGRAGESGSECLDPRVGDGAGPGLAVGGASRLHLHASRLAFRRPSSGERVAFTSTPPFALD